jgi:hypothetical protein
VGERTVGLDAGGARPVAQRYPRGPAEYLPLTTDVLTAHLSGDMEIGLHPLLDGDRCWWLAADFDGPAAILDALAYLKAARAVGARVALEVSRSGTGAHAMRPPVRVADPVLGSSPAVRSAIAYPRGQPGGG